MSVTSRLTIINGVLSLFAQKPVATIDENDNSTIINYQIDRLVPLAQKATIDWDFLRVTTTLTAPLVTSLSPNWKNTFAFPNDYLRIKKVFYSPNGDFEIRGNYILTNAPSLVIDYIQSSTAYELFPLHFVDFVIYYIALRLAIPLTRQQEIEDAIGKAFLLVKEEAEVFEKRLQAGYNTALNRYSRMNSRVITV